MSAGSTTYVTSFDQLVLSHVPKFSVPPPAGSTIEISHCGQQAEFVVVGYSISPQFDCVVEVRLPAWDWRSP